MENQTNSGAVIVNGEPNQIPGDTIELTIPINEYDSFIFTTDGKVYMQSRLGVYSSELITKTANSTLAELNCTKRFIPWPIKITEATDVMFSHNSTIEIWYESSEGTIRIWRGEAWALPDEYKELSIIKFFGSVTDNIWESDGICILVDATDNTPRNLKAKYHNTENCCDNDPNA